MATASTPAYYNTAKILPKKRFIVQALGGQPRKPYMNMFGTASFSIMFLQQWLQEVPFPFLDVMVLHN